MKIYKLDLEKVNKLIDIALREDIGDGDITTESIFPDSVPCKAVIKSKENGILCGSGIARLVFEKFDSGVLWEEKKSDGDKLSDGDIVAKIEGNQKHILTAERVALNLLQRMSGISTLTAKYVDAVEGLPAKIVDTRKTLPGLRVLEKYAVTVGGGFNHRFGLFDGVMIKDNHIKLAGSIGFAVEKVRSKYGGKFKIEVETTNPKEVKEALSCGADIIMLDNMDTKTMREAVSIIDGRALIEASGGITLENVRDAAETGVDFISVGALTHSAKALDISLDML
ncbi:MAG: carboxylating nicotinate-nucleotide diphosphorylase [Thermodesulfobacteriota bacterium]